MQRVTVAPGMLVHGCVAGAANGAEELVDLGGQRAGVAKALEEIHLLLVREPGKAEVGGGVLGEDFTFSDGGPDQRFAGQFARGMPVGTVVQSV